MLTTKPAWNDLVEAVTSPDAGMAQRRASQLSSSPRARARGAPRVGRRRQLLELEIALNAGTPVEFAMQFELARVLEDELFDDESAAKRTSGCSSCAPDNPTAEEALERGEAKREKWQDLVERYVDEAEQTTDDTFKSSLLMSAAEVAYRYGERNKKALAEIAGRLEEALASSTPRTCARRCCSSASTASQENWQKVARVLEILARATRPARKSAPRRSCASARVLARKLEARRARSGARTSACSICGPATPKR